MKIITVVAFVAAAYLAYEAARVGYLAFVSGRLVADAEPFEQTTGTRSVLVLGDSTAVGVGAETPGASVAGRLAGELNLTVENYAKSGAVVADVRAQLGKATQSEYNLILIQAGANDVIQLHNLEAVNKEMRRVLQEAQKKSDRVVVLTAGKIGQAPLFPWFVRSLMTNRAKELRDMLQVTAGQEGAAYVDLYFAADPFASDPKRYYAPDGLHLSGDGYDFWAGQVLEAIEARWPEFLHG